MYLEQGLAVIDIYMAFREKKEPTDVPAARPLSFPSNRRLLERPQTSSLCGFSVPLLLRPPNREH
jgi:hypothetical protein